MTIGESDMNLPVAACPRLRGHAAAVGGSILATIRGSLGTSVGVTR